MRTDEQIVPMQYEHLFGLKLGPHDAEYEKYIPNYRDYIYDNSVFGWSWTGVGRGRIVCCFGLRDMWPGLVELWLLPGEGIDRHVRTLLVGARAILKDVISDSDIRRVQIAVKVEHEAAFRFAKALGFEVECILRKYGPEGADYYSMARFS